MVQTTPGLILEMEKSVIDGGGGGGPVGVVAGDGAGGAVGGIPDGVAEAAAGGVGGVWQGCAACHLRLVFLAWSGQG